MADPTIREQPLEDGGAKTSPKPAAPVKKRSTSAWLVPVIIVILAGVVVIWRFAVQPAQRRAKARHDVDVLAVAIDGFAKEHSEYPRGDAAQICRLLLGETVDGQNTRRLDYVEATAYEINAKGEFVDPWGTPYQFILRPFIRIYSSGPNRTDEKGAGDDIASAN
jgi:type II secretory pathway pseudopilin PulG